MNGDEHGFKRYIVLYVILSAITGAIGSVQRLCFRLAGVRMAIGARNKLFRGVISQVSQPGKTQRRMRNRRRFREGGTSEWILLYVQGRVNTRRGAVESAGKGGRRSGRRAAPNPLSTSTAYVPRPPSNPIDPKGVEVCISGTGQKEELRRRLGITRVVGIYVDEREMGQTRI